MALIVRFPRAAAWIVCCALVAAISVECVLGLSLVRAPAPHGVAHVHGFVVAVRSSGAFALRVDGHPGVLWFTLAAGAPISLAHLLRHLRERAGTDVIYQALPHGVLVAWSAD